MPVVYAVTRPVIDLEFVDALPHGTVPAEVPKSYPVEPDTGFLPRGYVPEPVKPLLKRLPPVCREIVVDGIREGFHDRNVAYKLQ